MVGIVLLNYNNWELTIECIKSIRETTCIHYMIYVVDNASTVKKTEDFSTFIETSDDCILIENKMNKGFSAGNNVGLHKALEDKCDYILLSNNDVIFKKSSIEKMMRFLEKNNEYGIVGPKVYLPSGELQEINLGCKMTISGKYKYLLRKTIFRTFTKEFVRKFHADDKDKTHNFEVYAVSGCCFMISNQTAKELYPLDEKVFLYEEESIIGYSMQKLNKKTMYLVDSEIIHLGGASTNGMSMFAYACFIYSEQYYCSTYLNAYHFQRMPLLFLRVIIGIKYYGIGFIKILKETYKRGM